MRFTLPFFLVVLVMLAGCTTSYGPRSYIGGYTETKIDDVTYRVTFFGNGNTTRDMVWNYWIYRCAELTTQKGYEFFLLSVTPNKITNAPQSTDETVQLSDSQRYNDSPVSQMATHAAPAFIYVPGNTITSYSGSGIIKMLRQPGGYNGLVVLRASTIMQTLAVYIKSKGHVAVPSSEEILKAAFAGTVITTPDISKGDQLVRPITMDDLKNLLPIR